MAEAHVPLDPPAEMPDAARLDALAGIAAMFPWPLPRERDEAVRHQLAHLVDAVLAPLAKGRGAVEIAIGEGLAALKLGGRVVHLGYSNINDYAREALGIKRQHRGEDGVAGAMSARPAPAARGGAQRQGHSAQGGDRAAGRPR